jgi:RND family efflux transporter MFP subunit
MKRATVSIFAGVLWWTGCSAKPESPATPVQAARKADPIPLRTAAVETRLTDRTVDVTGSLHADDSVSVSSELNGRIEKIHFDFGQTVRQGDVLVELQRTELQIQLDRSRAALAQALARIGLNPDQEQTTPTTTPAIRQAQAQMEDARSKYEAARKLAESGDIARERFIELEKALQSRQAALEAAQDELRTQLANIQALAADKRLIEKRLGDTLIRAPFDGQVSQRLAAPGQFARDNTPLMTIVKTWPLRLRLDVPEVGAAAVRVGDALRFTTDAIPGKEFSATVTQLNPSLEARSRSLAAEARLNQASPLLRPGMFVQVRLTVTKAAQATVVPAQAVQTVAGLTKMFAIRQGRVREIRFVPVQTLLDGWIEVPSGTVAAGDRVAVDNLANLIDGMEVKAN